MLRNGLGGRSATVNEPRRRGGAEGGVMMVLEFECRDAMRRVCKARRAESPHKAHALASFAEATAIEDKLR